MSREKREELEQKFLKFGEWITNSKLGVLFGNFPGTVLLVLLIFFQSVYWLTAWWSPIPFVVFTLTGFALVTYLGGSPLTIYSLNIQQAATTEIGAKLAAIGLPFLLIQVAALFACLYMFGDVVDSQQRSITTSWDHFFFSVVTLTTLGYGNFVPNDGWAEFIAVIEALLGFMVFAIYAGILATIVIQRTTGHPLSSEGMEAQGGAFLSSEQIQELKTDQAIGTSYFLRFVYITIFGSQYLLLTRLNAGGRLHVNTIKAEYYVKFITNLASDTTPASFDAWLGYLTSNLLLTNPDNEGYIEITNNGRRFAQEVVDTGSAENFIN